MALLDLADPIADRGVVRAAAATAMRAVLCMGLAGLAGAGCSTGAAPTKAQLGEQLFADPKLSSPAGQACADCHAQDRAFSDPESSHTSSMGVVAGRFGVRNAPTAMYAQYVPALHFDKRGGGWVGGLFWDGRADTLAEQAAGPLLNPLEMNNPDRAAVVAAVRRASYAPMVRELYGPRALDDVDAAFAHVEDALAAYEHSAALAPFSSRYDRYLAGAAALTAPELRGLAIFEDPRRGNCAGCHPSRPGPRGEPALFTDFRYANLGIPRYTNNKFYDQPRAVNPEGDRYTDHGLMQTTGSSVDDGKFRTPTLRNIAATPPYGHNGYFENLSFLLDFLNTRDVGSVDAGTCSRASSATRCGWPGAEVPATVDPTIGRLGLSDQDLADLEAFLETLTDEPTGS